MERMPIRPAHTDELATLLDMHAAALRTLGRRHYAPEVIELAPEHMCTTEPALIVDGTYFVAEVDGRIAGGAGWSASAIARLLCTR